MGDFNDKNTFYGKVCDLTLSDMQAGTIIGGVVSSSGFGDGGYKASLGKNAAGETVAIEITFIEEGDGQI